MVKRWYPKLPRLECRWPRSASQGTAPDSRYRVTGPLLFLHQILDLLPPAYRERVAERLLRRRDSPGPAAEHAVQYRLSAAKHGATGRKRQEATIARGADNFYDRQYRQSLNAVMGAFAATATQIVMASGGACEGRLWQRRRRTFAAWLGQTAGVAPLLVIDQETVAVPLWLPPPKTPEAWDAARRWLAGQGLMPDGYSGLVRGEEIRSVDRSVRAYERNAAGAVLEVVDAALASRRLALLALHPQDPDAMGLHITLCGVDMLTPSQLERNYGFASGELEYYHVAARLTNRWLRFAVGGIEEVFTQCSQNLFVKRPLTGPVQPPRRPGPPDAWNPTLPLARLLRHQFELVQVTVSASGLPGASPRNGDLGKAAFVGHLDRRTVLLIPYHPGNAVHGHAAKLWSNPYGSVVISDDHHALSRITLSGPAYVVEQAWVERTFPDIARQVAAQCGRHGAPLPPPEYWFLQEVAELVQERECLAAYALAPERAACTLSAGGQARHGKKPGYFAADELPRYDWNRQHAWAARGRPTDPSGRRRRLWLETVNEALSAREAHLRRVAHSPDNTGASEATDAA